MAQSNAAALKQAGFDQGLLLYPGNGTADGHEGCHILFAPPFIALPGRHR